MVPKMTKYYKLCIWLTYSEEECENFALGARQPNGWPESIQERVLFGRVHGMDRNVRYV